MLVEKNTLEQVEVTEGKVIVTLTPWAHGDGVDVVVTNDMGTQSVSIGPATLYLMLVGLTHTPYRALVCDAANRSREEGK